MKYFSATYGDAIKFNKKPDEDYYLVSQKLPIFVIADGVTRSHSKDGRYSCRNGARKAAEVFCKSVLSYLEQNFDPKKINEAFNFANQKIGELNIEFGIKEKLNYIEYDWLDTVGVAGIISEGVLYYGYVGDCGLIVFDKDNQKKFQTEDMVFPAIKKAREIHKNWKRFALNKRRLIMRKKFRNNPDKKGYGTFSGEKGVENYYNLSEKKLEAGDIVVFYSDGFLEYIKDERFIKILRAGDKKRLNDAMFWKIIKHPIKCGHDRTFISINIDNF